MQKKCWWYNETIQNLTITSMAISPENLQKTTPEKQPVALEMSEQGYPEKLEMLNESLEERGELSRGLTEVIHDEVYVKNPEKCGELLDRCAKPDVGLLIRNKLSEMLRHGQSSKYMGESSFGQRYDRRKVNDNSVEKTTREIYEEDLQRLESKGNELIKSKDEFTAHQKSQKKAVELIESISDKTERANLQEKLATETADRESLIAEDNETLQEQLNVYRESLEHEQTQLNEVISRHNETLQFINTEAKNLQDAIKKTDKDIATASKLTLLGDTGQKIVESLKAQREEAQKHLDEFREKEKIIRERLEGMKANKTEIDAELKRMNNISKTKDEQEAEKREKKETTKQKTAEQQPQVLTSAALETQKNTITPAAETEEETEYVEEDNEITDARQATKPTFKKISSDTKNTTTKENATNVFHFGEESNNESTAEKEQQLSMTIQEWVNTFGEDMQSRAILRSYFKNQDKTLIKLDTATSEKVAIPNIVQFLIDTVDSYKGRPVGAFNSVNKRLAEIKAERAQATA